MSTFAPRKNALSLQRKAVNDVHVPPTLAERLEPRKEPEGTTAVGPRTGPQFEEEATVVIRRIELEYNRERTRA